MPTLTDRSGSDRLPALIEAGAAQARASGRPVLVSIVERVKYADPLGALAAWAGALGSEAGHRVFWSRPRQQVEVACFGEVAEVTAGGVGRFTVIREAKSTLLDRALVEGPSAPRDGVGPMLVGGLSFHPEGPATDDWRDFPAVRFVIPRVQLARTGDEHWLTLTLLVGADATTDVDPSVLDRYRQVLESAPGPQRTGAPGVRFTDDLSPDAWGALVADAVREIGAGAFDKVVLARSRRCHADASIDAHAVLRRLAHGHPDCFVFGVWHGDGAFVGASPERLVRVDGAAVQASSLAGSAPRGASAAEDSAHAAALAESAKDLGEHALVREALVGSLERFCDDVEAAPVPSLFTLPNVHHLHTAVTATLRDGHTIADLVEALHPTPAVGGAPREPALAYMRAHEPLDRGWYAAPVGFIAGDRGEFAVALRSAIIRENEAMLFAGCGIVATSDPVSEYAETLLKLRPIEDAITAAAMDAA